MQRIHHHLAGVGKLVEQAVLGSHYQVSLAEFVFNVTLARHSVVVESVYFVHAVIECATHGDVYFLNSTTGPENWHALSDAFTDQRQHRVVARRVAHFVVGKRRAVVVVRFYVRASARQHQPVEPAGKIGEVVIVGQCRNDHRHGPGPVGHATNIALADAMLGQRMGGQINLAGGDADERFRIVFDHAEWLSHRRIHGNGDASTEVGFTGFLARILFRRKRKHSEGSPRCIPVQPG